MRRIRNTFEELNPSRHWKFESPYLKHNVKISTESSLSCFHQIDISDIKHFFKDVNLGAITKVGNTDQLDHERR